MSLLRYRCPIHAYETRSEGSGIGEVQPGCSFPHSPFSSAAVVPDPEPAPCEAWCIIAQWVVWASVAAASPSPSSNASSSYNSAADIPSRDWFPYLIDLRGVLKYLPSSPFRIYTTTD